MSRTVTCLLVALAGVFPASLHADRRKLQALAPQVPVHLPAGAGAAEAGAGGVPVLGFGNNQRDAARRLFLSVVRMFPHAHSLLAGWIGQFARTEGMSLHDAAQGRPIIGVLVNTPAAVVNPMDGRRATSYVIRAIRAAGGFPVLLAPGGDPQRLAELMRPLDALVLTGGRHVHPYQYRRTIEFRADPVQYGSLNRKADIYERALMRVARAQGKAILAICHGMQVIVSDGGALIQGVPEPQQHKGQGPSFPELGLAFHRITLKPGGVLSTLLGGATETLVASVHRQSADPRKLPRGLQVDALAPDGVIEAVYGDGDRVLGVQFHPEVDGELSARYPLSDDERREVSRVNRAIFAHLVGKATAHARRRSRASGAGNRRRGTVVFDSRRFRSMLPRSVFDGESAPSRKPAGFASHGRPRQRR